MALDSWMPIGLTLPDGEQVRIALQEGLNWQIYESKAGSRILVVKELLANRWIESGLVWFREYLINYTKDNKNKYVHRYY